MRGAWLPAGDYQLQYRYRPASYRYGVTLSGLSWILLIGWGLWMERASRRRVRPKKIEYVSPWRDHG
ncbi:MAG: hypothetical protein HQ581_14250, partial [Planctomycetes bacterium]|nr:hypothetical protein [Planctomycetota bacterium]